MAFETLVFVGEIYSASVKLLSLKKFIQDHLTDLLIKMGQMDLDAATDLLNDAGGSRDPEREITAALGLLQSAYQKFIGVAEKNSLRSALAAGFLVSKRPSSYKSACEVALLIAAIYTVLEERNLRDKYLERSTACFERFAELHIQMYLTPSLSYDFRLPECISGEREIRREVDQMRSSLLFTCSRLKSL